MPHDANTNTTTQRDVMVFPLAQSLFLRKSGREPNPSKRGVYHSQDHGWSFANALKVAKPPSRSQSVAGAQREAEQVSGAIDAIWPPAADPAEEAEIDTEEDPGATM